MQNPCFKLKTLELEDGKKFLGLVNKGFLLYNAENSSKDILEYIKKYNYSGWMFSVLFSLLQEFPLIIN